MGLLQTVRSAWQISIPLAPATLLELQRESEQQHLGGLFREWNELDAAAEAVQGGIELGQAWKSSGVVAGGYVGLARVLQARGDLDGALALVDQAETVFERASIPRGVAQVDAYRALLRLAKGRPRGRLCLGCFSA